MGSKSHLSKTLQFCQWEGQKKYIAVPLSRFSISFYWKRITIFLFFENLDISENFDNII